MIDLKAAKLGAEIAANRKKATTAIHAGIQRQSRRAFLMGQASDPILAMACPAELKVADISIGKAK